MEQTRWLSEQEHRAWAGFNILKSRLDGELASRLGQDSCLSMQDYIVLVVLTEHPDGALRLFELGQFLSWEKSRLSHHITRMEKRGLVTKEKCDSDRRGWTVVITKHGLAEIEAAAPKHVEAVRELFIDQLTPEEIELIGDIADRLIPRIGTCPTEVDADGCLGD